MIISLTENGSCVSVGTECPQCGYSHKYSRQVTNSGDNKLELECPSCGKRWVDKFEVDNHMFECEKCGSITRYRTTKKSIIDQNIPPIQCGKCGSDIEVDPSHPYVEPIIERVKIKETKRIRKVLKLLQFICIKFGVSLNGDDRGIWIDIEGSTCSADFYNINYKGRMEQWYETTVVK
jgi:uncharacterized Zn finger protein